VKAKYSSNVWLATAFSYLDRGAAFVCPLLVLKWLDRGDAYIAIEYIISLSIILATFFDAGLRGYMLYAAKKSNSTNESVFLSIAMAFKPLAALHVLGIIIAVTVGWIANAEEPYLIGLAIARASALAATGLVAQGLILVGRPAFSPLISIANWGLSCISMLLPVSSSDMTLTVAFFSGSFAIVLAALLMNVRGKFSENNIRSSLHQITDSLGWGWPLLISAAASMMVGNFSKVYAFSNLPKEDVLAFTFWMRAFSVVQLSHVAIVSILIGQIYKTSQHGVLFENLMRYLRFIAPPAMLILFFGVFGNIFVSTVPFLTIAATIVLFFYFCLWCLGAYLEVYLSRNGENSIILKSSLWSSAIYVFGIVLWQPNSASHLALIMAASAAFYTVLIVWKIKFKT